MAPVTLTNELQEEPNSYNTCKRQKNQQRRVQTVGKSKVSELEKEGSSGERA